MTGPSVTIDGLGKRYRLDTTSGPYGRLSERLAAWRPAIRRGVGEEFWALRDVSFTVAEGEVMGVIGRNGAGKSTLLKILTRVTMPTAGSAEIVGRVGSLLEVGSGFHPELSGRENVFLNGAILGMRRREIIEKLDEIVDFAGIERFIDVPVKRYSSGMYMRLAFAVAAHLETEVLLVDEVLAVGDAAFQAKCLSKMGEVAGAGRTVLFVSHNMGAVSQLCDRCVWLDGGRIARTGEPDVVIADYLQAFGAKGARADFEPDVEKAAQFGSVTVRSPDGKASAEHSCDDPIVIELSLTVRERVPGLYLSLYLRGEHGQVVLFSDANDLAPDFAEQLTVGGHRFQLTVPARLLAPGMYSLTVGVASTYGGPIDHRENACSFRLRDRNTRRGDRRPGLLSTLIAWEPLLSEGSPHGHSEPQ